MALLLAVAEYQHYQLLWYYHHGKPLKYCIQNIP